MPFARQEDLDRLCRLYGYRLVVDPDPQARPDALGDTSQDRIGKAQLCRNKQIAIQSVDQKSAVYCVSHELAHGRIGFCDEKDVLAEQAYILAAWVAQLLAEIIQYEEATRQARAVGSHDVG